MNQILVTEKLYVTPELKRKKKLYKVEFFLSIFFVCLLFSAYIYAEYDKTKSEEISQEILSSIENETIDNKEDDNTTVKMEDNVLVVVLSENEQDTEESEELNIDNLASEKALSGKYKAGNGKTYNTVGTVKIRKIDVNYPILDYNSTKDNIDTLLKISITKFWGPDPNEVGNLCIVGHNYKNKRFFSKVPTLTIGDTVEITDLSGKTIKYSVYKKEVVKPENTECTSQLTNGKKEVTLITCTDDSKERVIVKCKEIK